MKLLFRLDPQRETPLRRGLVHRNADNDEVDTITTSSLKLKQAFSLLLRCNIECWRPLPGVVFHRSPTACLCDGNIIGRK